MKIIIEGAGEVGSHLAKMLSHEGGDITVIDDNAERIEKLSLTADVTTVSGDLSSIQTLKEAGVEKADLFIAVNPRADQSINIISAILAKKLGAKRVTARINDEDYLSAENQQLFKDMGIDLLFYPEKIASDEIIDLLKQTATTDAIDFARGKLRLAAFKLDEDSPLLDLKVAEFTAKVTAADARTQFRIVAISRHEETLIPKYDTRFKMGDHIYIIARREGIETLLKFIGIGNIDVDRVMVLGGGKIGEMVASRLSGQISEVKVIEKDRQRVIPLFQEAGWLRQ